MNSKLKILLSVILALLILAALGWAYWHFFMTPATMPLSPGNETSSTQPGFQPLDHGTGSAAPGTSGQTGTTGSTTAQGGTESPLPTLRLLSDTPVGGYAASTTASSTLVRWIDRGRGNIYQASYDGSSVQTLSNTVVPKVFQSVWSRGMSSFIGSFFDDGDLEPTTVYAELRPKAGSTTASVAPFDLKGKNIPGTVVGYAASPDRTRVFIFMDENGTGTGYVSSFSGQGMTRIFTTPITQVNVDWPSDNIIAITTKGSAAYGGFLYFVDPKTGIWKKALGPIMGLSAVVSRTGRYVLYSSTAQSGVSTSIYSVGAATSADAVIRTLADKCAWGNFYKDLVYCAVPSLPVNGTYPDGWYLGTMSSVDKLWQVNAATGEIKLVSDIVSQADRVIDAFDLGLDQKDGYLFFMNKNDLSLWSLDLTGTGK